MLSKYKNYFLLPWLDETIYQQKERNEARKIKTVARTRRHDRVRVLSLMYQ